MSTSNTPHTPSIGFAGLLGLIFITLKLCGVINWSWLWVLAPIWMSIGIAILFVIVLVLIGAFATNNWYKH